MSKRKGEEVLSAFDGYDEGIRLLLEETQRRAEESHLPPAVRKKMAELKQKEEERKRKAKEKWEKAKGMRVSVYLPKSLQQEIQEIAQTEGTSESQVMTYLLFEAVERYKQKEIGFWGYKHPSESPRYDFILVHPKDTERTKKIGSRKSQKNGWNA
ncbi:hypothetical protein [Bellilinea sp.]|uniref:hypothetical protein n=1 Tax=Bellilinea sp. TaxID=2838785 RepID=UPI0021DBE960|nr:hypothetical protein [Bellilinea sp.]GIV64803.1 MAG: hypothetical protein KatS3mg046_063 [Bellilinea sp.]